MGLIFATKCRLLCLIYDDMSSLRYDCTLPLLRNAINNKRIVLQQNTYAHVIKHSPVPDNIVFLHVTATNVCTGKYIKNPQLNYSNCVKTFIFITFNLLSSNELSSLYTLFTLLHNKTTFYVLMQIP